MRLLQMSISAGILIGFILILRCVGRRLFSARFLFLLWFVAVARMAVPLELPIQLPGIGLEKVLQDEDLPTGQTVSGKGADIAAPERVRDGRNMWFNRLAVLIWADVCLLLLIAYAWTYIRQMSRMQESLPLTEQACLTRWKESHPIRRDVGFMVFDRIAAPVTYGIWKPRIVFPKDMDMEDSQTVEYILRHEYVHIRRFDNLWKIAVLAVVCVHWFNPLAWVMWRCFNRDMELSCDQSAVAGMDGSGRRAYAMTLLRFAEKNHKVSLLCNSFGENAVKERIMMLMKNHKKTKIGIVCSILVMTLSMTVFASVSGSSTGTAGSVRGKSPAAILSETPQFAEYEAMGLIYDPALDHIGYKNKIVGYFSDEYASGTFNRMDDLAGSLCLAAERDGGGRLTGFREVETTDYLKQAAEAEVRMAQGRGFIKEYGPYGLSYDQQTGYLSYDGKLVESIRDSAGCGISVYGAVASLGPTTSLQVNRDENGAVTDIKQMTPEEMSEILSQTIGVQRTENGWKGE